MRVLYIVLGLLFLALGTVGIGLPLLPTVPFYLLAAFFLGKGSRKLDAWFKGTGFYQAHVKPLQEGKGMTVRAKAKAFGTVTLLLGLGFIFMSAILWGRRSSWQSGSSTSGSSGQRSRQLQMRQMQRRLRQNEAEP